MSISIKNAESLLIESFILIEWSINKIFTVFQNFKNVKLNDLVTCKVNNKNDVGRVIFIGSEVECNNVLENYKGKKTGKKKSLSKHLKNQSKLNLPDNERLRPNSTTNFNLNSNSAFLLNKNKTISNRTISKSRSIENELNTFECDDEVANINSHNSIDFRTIDTLNGCNDFKVSPSKSTFDYYYDSQSEHSDDVRRASISSSVCTECVGCQKLKHELNTLSRKLKFYESMYTTTPQVLQWFENLKNAYKFTAPAVAVANNPNNLIKKMSIVDINSSLLNQQEDISYNRRDNNTNNFKINQPIPEIVIDDII